MSVTRKKLIFRAIIVVFVAALLGNSHLYAVEPETYAVAGFDYVRNNDPNLTGNNIKVCMVERSENYDGNLPLFDYKPDITHPLLKNANIKTPLQKTITSSGVSFHSTAICSILTGSGLSDSQTGEDSYSSPLKDAQIEVVEFWEFVVDYILSNDKPLDADILSASFGTALPDWWTRAIQFIIARDNVIGVASIGNGGEVFGSCLYPAAGANFIAVGIADKQMLPLSDSNWLEYSAESSYGTTFEGITKPDIVAPGNYLVADLETGGLTESGNYSSYAAPAVAAIAGILVQEAKEHEFNAAFDTDGANCTIKAILMSSASKGAGWHKGDWDTNDDKTSPLDARQGSGIINAAAAYDLLNCGQLKPATTTTSGWDNASVDGKSENTYQIEMTDSNHYINATLVWDRKFSPQYPFDYMTEENIDLRLELWSINDDDPNNNTLVDYSDSSVSNVEHIFCPAGPIGTKYELVVVFSDNEDAAKINLSQQYGLAITTTPMPEQWKGQWLDFDADGNITLNDLSGIVQFTTKNGSKDNPDFNIKLMNTVKILLGELANRSRFQ